MLSLVAVVMVFLAFKFMELRDELRKYERKFKHQQDELRRAAKINEGLRQNRDEWKKYLAMKLDTRLKKTNDFQQDVLFTKDQINSLIQLCHPDRHGGKQSAVDITAALITIRNKYK